MHYQTTKTTTKYEKKGYDRISHSCKVFRYEQKRCTPSRLATRPRNTRNAYTQILHVRISQDRRQDNPQGNRHSQSSLYSARPRAANSTTEHSGILRCGERRMEKFPQVKSSANPNVKRKTILRAILGSKNCGIRVYSFLSQKCLKSPKNSQI